MTSERVEEAGGPADAAATGVTRLSVPGAVIELRPHNCFACGQLNVGGLHLALHVDDRRCWTELSLPARFEGWEGIAHGGILCTILDEVMAWALVERDDWGVTARLSVEFRRPVPIGQAIRAEGWITEGRRRVVHTAGRIVDAASGTELATAEGLYVAAPEARKRDLKQRYDFRLVRDPERVAREPEGARR
ncbi:MAG TPA: PaaI family thioesterase [Candidatus Limnocylindrales bacterium]